MTGHSNCLGRNVPISMGRLLLLAVAFFSISGTLRSAVAQSPYTITTLNGPGATNTEALGINDVGQIVGWYYNSKIAQGFIYKDGTFTNLDVPGTTNETIATGINDDGQVVGWYYDSKNDGHGFIYSNGTFTVLNAPGAVSTWPYAINNAGEVVGYFFDGVTDRGFIYSAGSFATIDAPVGGASNGLDFRGVNDAGQIVGGYGVPAGTQSFIYTSGSFKTFDLPGATETFAYGINNAGQIVGDSTSGIFVYTNGTFTALTALYGLPQASLSGINSIGQIVGQYARQNNIFSSFVATPGPPTIYFLSPTLLVEKAGGVLLSNLDLASALQSIGKPSVATASALVADATSAAIVLVDTGGDHADNVTLTASNAILFPYSPDFWTTAPQSGASTPVTITPEELVQVGSKWYAAAWLQAPEDGKANLAANITVTAKVNKLSNVSISAYLNLLPPPVVFVHGLWGDVTSLKSTQDFLSARPPWNKSPNLVAIDYPGDIAFNLAGATDPLEQSISTIITKFDQSGIVGSRVDVVGHSMGGLLTRAYAATSSYLALRNRRQGYVHQTVTLDTPEQGSNVATYFVNYATTQLTGDIGTVCALIPLWACAKALGMPIYGADGLKNGPVLSLQPSYIQGLVASGKLPTPDLLGHATWHAITAEADIDSTLKAVLNKLIALTDPGQSVDKIFGTYKNDGVVDLDSQVGAPYYSPKEYAFFQGLQHTGIPYADKLFPKFSDANVTHSDAVNDVVACWLINPTAQCAKGAQTQVATMAKTGESLPLRIVSAEVTAQGPYRRELGRPFIVDLAKPGIIAVAAGQSDEAGHRIGNELLRFEPTVGGHVHVSVTPKLLGKVTFTISAAYPNNTISLDNIVTQIRIPQNVTPILRADRNLTFLALDRPGGRYRVSPVAMFPDLDQPVPVSNYVTFSIVAGSSVAKVEPNGTIVGISSGSALVQVRLGKTVDLIEVHVGRW